MQRLGIVAAVAAVTALVVSTTAVVTATLVNEDDDAPAHWMMSGQQERDRDGDPPRERRSVPRMPGAAVDLELEYLTQMVAHHREGIAAARELRRSDRRQMRQLGARIVASQTTQVEQMQRWLDDWYAGPSGGDGYQPMMRDLSGLSGDALDRAFLQDMIVHHMVAVMKSQHLLVRGADEHPEVAELAQVIRDEQRREILGMHRWLRQWFG